MLELIMLGLGLTLLLLHWNSVVFCMNQTARESESETQHNQFPLFYYEIFSEESSIRRKYVKIIDSVCAHFFLEKKSEKERCNLKFNRKTRRHHKMHNITHIMWERMQNSETHSDAPPLHVKAFKYANQNMLNRNNISFCYCHFAYFATNFRPIIH